MRRAPLHVVTPVVLGVLIYLSWRTPTLRVFRWAETLGLGDALADVRGIVSGTRIALPRVVLFSLPDGLWVYALTAAMLLLWRRQPPGFAKYCWIASAFVLAVGAELGQAIHVVRGTFDIVDLASYAVFAAAACIAGGRSSLEPVR